MLGISLQALASGLKQNRSLKTLHLSIPKSSLWGAWFNSGALGRQAGGISSGKEMNWALEHRGGIVYNII